MVQALPVVSQASSADLGERMRAALQAELAAGHRKASSRTSLLP